MLLKNILHVIRTRPTFIYPYVRQTLKFYSTRLLYRIFKPKSIYLGKNVRIQDFSSMRVEVPVSKILVGDNSIIWEKCKIEAVAGGVVEIGSYTEIARTSIAAKEHVYIGNFVGIAHNTYIQDFLGHPSDPEIRVQERKRRLEWFYPRWDTTAAKRPEKYPFDPETKPVRIEDKVIIYRNVLILRGVTIGEGSVVAANTVVTKDIPPYSFVAGNPAKVIKSLR